MSKLLQLVRDIIRITIECYREAKSDRELRRALHRYRDAVAPERRRG